MKDRKNGALWGIAILVLVWLSVNHWGCKGVLSGPQNSSTDQAQTITENVIRLTTNWSDWVEPGYDKNIVTHMKTPNLWWQLKVKYVGGGEEVFDRTPVNYPESDMLRITRPVETACWRIAPMGPTSLNKGSKLEGELRWHREPKK
jgi:hypothetical protein